ncbi:hypothetical protein J4405_05885 [Candidatus Woesearchaeota archaeon]|nr:hypothetical protein [Candidatus Woesearchaeota archaeon]
MFFKKKENTDVPKPDTMTELPKLELPKFQDFDMNQSEEKHEDTYSSAVHDELPELSSMPKDEPEERSYTTRSQPSYSQSDRQLFVRVEDYKDAMRKLENIKDALKKTDDILAKLEDIRAEEEAEFSAWHEDIKKIKDRVLDIDSILFEKK